MTLPVSAIGYLVPRGGFAGRVHSVFERACNIEAGGSLLAVVAPDGDDGPATLRLARPAPADLSRLFGRGEPIVVRRDEDRSPRVVLSFAGAQRWRPPPPAPLLPTREIRARIARARARLAAHGTARASILARDGASVVAAFAAACRDRDRAALARCADRLIGWGEGLTPAGDDFLAGALAALDAPAPHCGERHALRAALAQAVTARLARTTAISVQMLRLAAGGHHGRAVLDARAALLTDALPGALAPALDRALAIGATSGAAALLGLLHTAAARLADPPPAP
jgi:hypothetical protein